MGNFVSSSETTLLTSFIAEDISSEIHLMRTNIPVFWLSSSSDAKNRLVSPAPSAEVQWPFQTGSMMPQCQPALSHVQILYKGINPPPHFFPWETLGWQVLHGAETMAKIPAVSTICHISPLHLLPSFLIHQRDNCWELGRTKALKWLPWTAIYMAPLLMHYKWGSWQKLGNWSLEILWGWTWQISTPLFYSHLLPKMRRVAAWFFYPSINLCEELSLTLF